jgi:hypothetical protein
MIQPEALFINAWRSAVKRLGFSQSVGSVATLPESSDRQNALRLSLGSTRNLFHSER